MIWMNLRLLVGQLDHQAEYVALVIQIAREAFDVGPGLL